MTETKKRRVPLTAVLLLLILAALFFLVGLALSRKDREAPGEFLAPVTTIVPSRGTIDKVLDINAFVETSRQVTVVPRISGTLLSLEAKMGEEVQEGQLLGKVDPASYELTFLQAQAAYLTAQSTFDRVGRLFENQAATRQSYEEARTAYEAAKSQYELSRLALGYTELRSPLPGVVLQTHAVEGSLVGPGVPVVTVGDPEDLLVRVSVPEIHYSFFLANRESMTVSMSVPALEERNFPLTISALAPYISPQTKSFQAECRVLSGQELLRPGMFVTVTFVLERRENVPYLPFQVRASGDRLWEVDSAGRGQPLEYVPRFFNEEVFQIPEEYAGKTFILEGQHFLTPGQKVNILSRRGEGN